MASIRMRGEWLLNCTTYSLKPEFKPNSLGPAKLIIEEATRSKVSGVILIGEQEITVTGRIRPGSPAVVTLSETDDDDEFVEYGLEALLFIPPWWPTIDYEFDVINGTLAIGENSKMKATSESGRLIMVTGIQAFEACDH